MDTVTLPHDYVFADANVAFVCDSGDAAKIYNYCRDDATKWAACYVHARSMPGIEDDGGLALAVGWFANAIECSSGLRQRQRDVREHKNAMQFIHYVIVTIMWAFVCGSTVHAATQLQFSAYTIIWVFLCVVSGFLIHKLFE